MSQHCQIHFHTREEFFKSYLAAEQVYHEKELFKAHGQCEFEGARKCTVMFRRWLFNMEVIY